MPRLWIANLEESIGTRVATGDAWLMLQLQKSSPGFLTAVEPGDALLAAHPVEAQARLFFRQLSGFGKEPLPVLVPGVRPVPFFLAEAALADRALFSQMRRLTATGSWRFEPFVETAHAHRLGQALSLPVGSPTPAEDPVGLADRVNDKSSFKKLTGEAGISSIPGSSGATVEEVRRQTFRIPPGPDGRLMLRRSRSAWLEGNLAGLPEDLRRALPGWFRPGRVLVEPLLPFASGATAVLWMSADGTAWGGVGTREVTPERTREFRFPLPDPALGSRLKTDALRLASRLWEGGGRGPLRLDWGMLDRGGYCEPVAIKARLGHGLLPDLLAWVGRVFGPVLDSCSLALLEDLPVREEIGSFADLSAALGGLRLAGEPLPIDRRRGPRGTWPLLPPCHGRCTLAVLGPDPAWVERVVAAVRARLA